MTIDPEVLSLVAGWSTLAAIGALILAGITIALFFGGAGDVLGPINDVFSALTLILLVPAVLAVQALAGDGSGAWLLIATVVGLVGIAVAAGGQLLLVAGVIELRTSFATGGIGVLLLGVWVVASAAVALGTDVLAVRTGWLAIGAIGLSVVTTLVAATGRRALITAVSVLLFVELVAWLASLAFDLLGIA
jgi:hypothetical protein